MNEKLGDELIYIKENPDIYESEQNNPVHQYDIANTDWTLVGVVSLDSLTIVKRQIIESIVLGSLLLVVGVVITGGLLKRLTGEIRNQEEELHRHEMNALYSQINPHFLYNTLDTIVWMAEFNETKAVIKTTKSLAALFRLSLNQDKKLIPLEDELNHVKQYIYIQKQRYQEKLNYTIDVEEKLNDCLVPKIILQPIVENSIYHGIKNLEGNGMIWITAKQEGDNLLIVIRDNGVGFNSSKGYKSKKKGLKLGGIGVTNVSKRLRLQYGNGYGVALHSVIGEGTVATLKLKMVK